LAPSLGPAAPAVRELLITARDRYPAFVTWLAERTGIEVPLTVGILEVAPTPAALDSLLRAAPAGTLQLDRGEVREREPALCDVAGALLHPLDGAVDNIRLLEAMREAARCEWAIDVVSGRAASLEWLANGRPSLVTEDGRRHQSRSVVLAAGAWAPLVTGLPRPLRVEPVRGQMLSLRASPLSQAISGPDVYLVPRGDLTVVGSTLERVGFDAGTTTAALRQLHRSAAALCPELDAAAIAESWAGLRPMTPDFQPVIGRDPERPALLYACGHGKNGILLAPLTGECVALLLSDTESSVDLAPFKIERFT
jgi:glycine oxidase